MKRRDFLTSGLAAGAGGLFLAKQAPSLAAEPTADRLDVALIGAGSQGRVLLEAALALRGVRIRAICDIWKYRRNSALAYLKNYGQDAKEYEDYRDLLAHEKGLHVAIVATPDFVHPEQVNACLKAGLDVYCEAMMAPTLAGARSMVQTMRETGRLLQIGYQRRSNPRYIHAYEKLFEEAELLGELTSLSGQWSQAMVEDLGWPRRFVIPDDLLAKYGYANMQQFRNWRWFRKHSAGPLATFAAGQMDVFCWFLGETPTSVMASGGIDYYKGHEWYDNAMAVYEYATPDRTVRAAYQMFLTTTAGGSGSFEKLMGTEGTIKLAENPKWSGVYHEANAVEWDDWVRRAYLVKVGTPPEKKPDAAKPEDPNAVGVRETGQVVPYDIPVQLHQPVCQPHLENLLDAVRGKAKLTCPADVALRSEVVALRTNEAIQARRPLELAPGDFEI